MAIKTKTELQTQSDNTFLDNNTGQITPVNHRAFNDDVLDTMFEGIAGRTVTKTQFDDLVTNSELVEGGVYKITDYPLTILGDVEIFVTAVSTSQIYYQAFCYIFDIPHILQINPDGSSAQVVKTLGRGVNYGNGEFYDWIENVVPSEFYARGAEFRVFTPTGTAARFTFAGIIATQADVVLNHNILGSFEQSGKYLLHKGFLSERPINNRRFFYPDHGDQDNWGDYNIPNEGQLGVLEFISSIYVYNFSNIKGNFQKVNNVVTGQVSAICDFTTPNFNANIDFGLPISSVKSGSYIAHGMARTTDGAHQFLIQQSSSYQNNDNFFGRGIIGIIGNHTNPVEIEFTISFSYTLNY